MNDFNRILFLILVVALAHTLANGTLLKIWDSLKVGATGDKSAIPKGGFPSADAPGGGGGGAGGSW